MQPICLHKIDINHQFHTNMESDHVMLWYYKLFELHLNLYSYQLKSSRQIRSTILVSAYNVYYNIKICVRIYVDRLTDKHINR